MSTTWAFNNIENKHTLYRREDCMKKFYESVREHSKNIIDFEKKKMISLTEEELKSNENGKVCYICRKRILKKLNKSKNYRNVRDHCYFTGKYRGVVHSICHSKFNVIDEIPEVFHNGSNYDYHFIIKELANQFGRKFECPGKNTEKYEHFSVSIEKEVTKIDEDSK